MSKLIVPESCMACSEWRDPEYGNDCVLMPNNRTKTLEDQYKKCPIRKLAERHKDAFEET